MAGISYRLRWPAEQLAREGHDIVIDPPLGYYRDPTGHDPARLYLDADIAVVQRITTPAGLEFVAALKDHGHQVVIDVDDDLDELPADHPYAVDLGARRGREVLHAACQAADVVTCSTPPLVDRYGYGKGVVLPNLVPEAYLRVRARRKGRPRVGWTGRPQSHIDDALVMGPVGRTVAAAGGLFAAWGQTAEITFRQVEVPAGARVTVPYRALRSGYTAGVAELSVGLAPLQDSPFCRAKSWLKMAEYAALGVPCVGSPLPEYRKLHELGVGLLATTPGEWSEHVGRLLVSPGERVELAEAGRAVMATLTYELHAGRWWSAWLRRDHDRCARVMSAVGE